MPAGKATSSGRGGTPPRRKLNGKHEVYVLARMAGANQTQAAIAAGFAARSARQRGLELERDPLIAARLKYLLAEKFKALHMEVDEILARTAMIARADPRALYDESGRLRPIHELTPEEAAAIAGLESAEAFEGGGKDRVKVADIRKVRLRDPLPALRLLAEHKKLVRAPDDGMNALANALADRLKAARERRRTANPAKESKP